MVKFNGPTSASGHPVRRIAHDQSWQQVSWLRFAALTAPSQDCDYRLHEMVIASPLTVTQGSSGIVLIEPSQRPQ